MTTRRILSLLIAIALATSALSIATVAAASPGHQDDGHHDTKKDKSKAKKKATKADRSEQTQQSVDQTSAPIGVLGTEDAPRDIRITMTDELRFDPGTIAIHQGETVRFVLENPTAAPHDFTLGDLDAQMHHHDEMAAGDMHEHAATGTDGLPEGTDGLPGAVLLGPGESAEVVATFDEPGEILIGCHVPGHWEAGMRASIGVMASDLVLGTPEAPRDIAVTMTDQLRFDPGTIAVHQGETVRFMLENPTVAPHDFTLGDLDAQLHHHEEMTAGAGHGHDADGTNGMPGAVMLEPGESVDVIATFTEPGEVLIGCHVPGHWEAGMLGSVLVMPGGVPSST